MIKSGATRRQFLCRTETSQTETPVVDGDDYGILSQDGLLLIISNDGVYYIAQQDLP